MNKKISKKQLVRRLMDKKQVVSIYITHDYVTAEVNDKFTPAMARDFSTETGYTNVRLACKEGANLMVFALN